MKYIYSEKLCKDCGYFKEDIIEDGVCWCSLDGAAIDKDDSCKIEDRASDFLVKAVWYIDRLLKEVEKDAERQAQNDA